MDTEWLFLLLGLILGLPLSIFANLATPWVRSYLKKRSLSRHERRLYNLATQYRHIRKLKENVNYLLLQGLVNIFWLLVSMSLIINAYAFMDASHHLFPPDNVRGHFLQDIYVVLGFLVLPLLLVGTFARDLFLVSDFDNYKKKARAKYVKLGGNPEDLDKEEAALKQGG